MRNKGTSNPGERAGERTLGLQINVAQLLKQTGGATRSYEIVDDIRGLEEEIEPRGPVRGTVDLLRTGQGILVTARFQVDLALTCTRCLEAYVSAVNVELQEEFRPLLDIATGLKNPVMPGDDQATLIDEHHILDLREVLRQGIVLSAPLYPVCREDCTGLCPQCGQNLNAGSCNCRDSLSDPRWEALRGLQVND